ncbi:MAG: hypothetical protein AAFQ68_26025 [Bacteroidota bacterium]
MTGQEEKQHLLEEIAQLREENTRLKAVSGLSQIPEPSELEVDPLFLKIKQQLIHLQDANIISLKAMELTQQAEQSLAAMIPALEVEYHGMHNQIKQLGEANVDLENTYVAVVQKLEEQLKVLKQELTDQEDKMETRLQELQNQQAELQTALNESQELNALYRQQLAQQQEQHEAAKANSTNPFKSLNIFDL